MLAETSPRRLLPRLLSILIAAVSFTPAAVRADTPGPLPQGYASDEPAAPAAEANPQVDYQQTQAVQADVAVSATATTDDTYLDTDPAALTDFHEPLAPYGAWVEDPTYGTIWVPNSTVVGADFAPYQTSGHWELDADSNWMWVSDYDWGYIPFHYGRWVYVGGRGWGWIPGRVYAPAWVNWRLTDYGYIGWAPMSPSWYWFNGAPVSVWVNSPSAYVFCPSSYAFHHHVYTYIVRDREVVQRIGAYSRPYHAAQPGVAHQAASPGVHGPGAPGGGNARAPGQFRPASPSLDEARIPAASVPQARAQGDARALAFAHRSTTAQARTMPAPSRSLPAATPAPAFHSSHEAVVRAPQAPTYQPRQPVASASTPCFQPAPSRSFTPAPSRSFTPAPLRSFTTTAPSRSFTPASLCLFTPAPSRSVSTPSPSRSFSPPAPSRSISTPSRSFSAPSRSFSAPSPSRSFSAPSRSFSGGGGHHHR